MPVEQLVYKQNHQNTILLIFYLPFFVTVLLYLFTTVLSPDFLKSQYFFILLLTTFVLTLLLAIIYNRFYQDQYIINSQGLIIKSRVKENIIPWNTIYSFSTISSESSTEYDLKTLNKKYRLQRPSNYQYFEQQIVKSAQLIPDPDNQLKNLIYNQSLKSWHKKE